VEQIRHLDYLKQQDVKIDLQRESKPSHAGSKAVFTNVRGTTRVYKQGTLKAHFTRYAHMFEAHWGLISNFRCALLQLNYLSISLLWKNIYKMVPFESVSSTIFSMPEGLTAVP
jgi:hypothetical protein